MDFVLSNLGNPEVRAIYLLAQYKPQPPIESMSRLQALDELLFSWINSSLANPVFDITMPVFTTLGSKWLVWPLLISICWFLPAAFIETQAAGSNIQQPVISRINTSFRLFLLLVLAYGINAGIYNSIKKITDRPRPFEQNNVELRVAQDDAKKLTHNGSFPSGHAANTFMLAVLLSVAKKRLFFIFYCVASIVAFSRIYLGVHFPSDVLAGACIGWGTTKILVSSRWVRTSLDI